MLLYLLIFQYIFNWLILLIKDSDKNIFYSYTDCLHMQTFTTSVRTHSYIAIAIHLPLFDEHPVNSMAKQI